MRSGEGSGTAPGGGKEENGAVNGVRIRCFLSALDHRVAQVTSGRRRMLLPISELEGLRFSAVNLDLVLVRAFRLCLYRTATAVFPHARSFRRKSD